MKTKHKSREDSAIERLKRLNKNLDIACNLCTALRREWSFEADTIGREEESQTILVYWIGCSGLADAARTLGRGQRIDRIGCTTERDIVDRLSAAAADAYGSWFPDALGNLRQQPGFTRWIMQALGTTRASRDPDVTVKARSIDVRLPLTMTRRSFDRALQIALSPWSLAARYPQATRYTNYSVGVDRMSKALELYVGLDPRRDGDRLLEIVESIVADHRAKVVPRKGDRRAGAASVI